MSTPVSTVDVVRDAIDAMVAVDGERLQKLIHPDIEVVEPESLPYGGVYQGASAFFEELLPALAGPFQLEVEDATIYDGGTSAASRMTVVFTSRRTGEVLKMPYVEVYDVEDGLIRRIDVYPQDVTRLTTFMVANA
jgi:ketosteroid isomerase-like protein